MGCGAICKSQEKVVAPSARGANHSSTVTTHQSDINLKNKVPERLQPRREDPSGSLSGHSQIPQSQSNFSETLDVKAVLSPRSSGTFNVICWCDDAATLKQLARDPLLEYVPEGSDQVIVFNRLSALSSPGAELPKRITAVVYLVNSEEDLPMVREFYKDHRRIWNHIVVAGEDFLMPRDLPLLCLRPEHNLPREIHNAYLDLITVIDAFLVTTKSATFQSISMSVHSEVNELLDIAGGTDMHQRLPALREFWTKGRLALWRAKEKLSKLLSRLGPQANKLLIKVQRCLATSIPPTHGRIKLSFSDCAVRDQCSLSFRLGFGETMQKLTSETAAIVKTKDCECWLALALVPKPESVTTIENSQLSQLAKRTMDSIVAHEPKLKDLFGYDIRFLEGKLYMSFWLSLQHAVSRENQFLQEFLSTLNSLNQAQEVRVAYRSPLTIDDFLARKSESLSSLLLEKSELELAWRLSAPLWVLLEDLIAPVLPGVYHLLPEITAGFEEISADLQLESAIPVARMLGSGAASVLFDRLRTLVREPVECSPPLMQQLQNSLEFYLPALTVVGRVQNLGVEVKGTLPRLVSLLGYDKTFAFL